jgi:uncharacterized repeat protein (TIGR04076 family)
MFEVTATVVSQKGTCEAKHRVGDSFVIGECTPPGLCTWAFCSLFSFASVLQAGASFSWEKEAGTSMVACPDPDNPVVFELRKGKPI